MSGLRCISYGGGVQSTALLVLAAQKRIDFSLFLMANVGDDSEHPDTLSYVHNVAAPYAKRHGIELHILRRTMVISLDEIQRANGRSDVAHQRIVYPLIGMGEETGLALRRDDCMRIIQEAGIPVPPKSSCYFCPFHSMDSWADMKRTEPDLFEKAAHLEDTINAKRADSYPVWLSQAMIPLREAVGDDAPLFEGDGSCDSGWCFT